VLARRLLSLGSMRRPTYRGVIALGLASILASPAARADHMQGYWVDDPVPPAQPAPPSEQLDEQGVAQARGSFRQLQLRLDQAYELDGNGKIAAGGGGVLVALGAALLIATVYLGLAAGFDLTLQNLVDPGGSHSNPYASTMLGTGLGAAVGLAGGVPLLCWGVRARSRARRVLEGSEVAFAPRFDGGRVDGGSLGVRVAF
jgi:hypothetical protein